VGCVGALDAALAALPADRYPIDHSDRGCQHCCHEYVDRPAGRSLPMSMTERNHCYENACAERVNGIPKQQYGLRMTLKDIRQARMAVDDAIRLYTTDRPHMNLDYRVPADVHGEVA